MLMSAELKVVSRDLYIFMDLLQLRYNCVKFRHFAFTPLSVNSSWIGLSDTQVIAVSIWYSSTELQQHVD